MSASPSFNIWAIADLHLSFGIQGKEMDVFGEEWSGWTKKIETHWRESIREEDLVLIPGDISWAMKPEDALPDLQWIDRLPGTKVLIKGNHDYWWGSKSKVEKIVPPSLHIIQNNAFHFHSVAVAGTRLWDTPEYTFMPYIAIKEGTPAKQLTAYDDKQEETEALFVRELQRLESSLKEMKSESALKICMTHYPPIGAALEDSRVSKLLERYNVTICVFGHLHSLKKGISLFGEKRGINYCLASADFLQFKPLLLAKAT